MERRCGVGAGDVLAGRLDDKHALAIQVPLPLHQHGRLGFELGGEHGVGAGECSGGAFLDSVCAGQGREGEASEVGDGKVVDGECKVWRLGGRSVGGAGWAGR